MEWYYFHLRHLPNSYAHTYAHSLTRSHGCALPFQPTLCVRHTRECAPPPAAAQHCNNSSSTLTLIISALRSSLFGSRRSVFIFLAPSSVRSERVCNCAPRLTMHDMCCVSTKSTGDAGVDFSTLIQPFLLHSLCVCCCC